MLQDLFVEHVWVAVLLVLAAHLSDYRLTIVGMRWYRRGADAHYDLGGSYELNPMFERDIEAERPASWRHLALVGFWTVLTVVVWWFTAREGRLEGLYLGFLGFLLLPQVPAHMGHIRNIALFRHIVRRGGATGHIATSRRLELTMAATVFTVFAGIYLALWLVVDEPFLLGGVPGALLATMRFGLLATEEPDEQEPEEAPPAE